MAELGNIENSRSGENLVHNFHQLYLHFQTADHDATGVIPVKQRVELN